MNVPLRHTIAKHTLMLSSSTYLQMFLAAITNFIVAKILGPANFGIISGIQVIVLFATLSNLGFMQAASVRIPTLRVEGKADDIQKVLRITYIMTMLPSLLIALGVTGLAFKRRGLIPAPHFWGYITFAIMLLLYQGQQLVINTYIRGWNRFDVQSKSLAISSLIAYPLIIFMVMYSGIYGQYGSQLIQLLIFILIVSRHLTLSFGQGWSWTIWKDMLRIGLPLMLTVFIITSMGNIDSFIILNVLAGDAGLAVLGLYTIGVRVMQFLHGINIVVYSIMLPRMQERFVESGNNKNSLWNFIEGPSIVLSTFMAIVTAVCVIACQYLIHNGMNQYTEAIDSMKILAWSSAVASTSLLLSMSLITIDKNWLRFRISFSTLILISIGIYLALKAGYGITTIAFIALTGRFIDSLLFIFFAGCQFCLFKKILAFFIRLYLPIFSLMGALLLSDRWITYGSGFGGDLPNLSIQMIVILTTGIASVLLLKRNVGVWDEGIGIAKIIFRIFLKRA